MEIPFQINELIIKNKNFKICESDPLSGVSAEIDSIGFYENKIYRKFGSNNIDWEIIFPERIRTITENVTLTNSDNIILIDASSNTITITLPQGSLSYLTKRFLFKVINVDNNIFIQAHTGETIEGSSSISLTLVNETIELILIDSIKWAKITTSGSSSNNSVNLIPTGLITSNYDAQPNDLVIVSTVSPITITLPLNPNIGDRIGIKDALGFAGIPSNRITINRNTRSIDGSSINLEIREKYGYVELVYTRIGHWSIVDRTSPNFEYDSTYFKIFNENADTSYIKFLPRQNSGIIINTGNLIDDFKLGNIAPHNALSNFATNDIVINGDEIFKALISNSGAFDRTQWKLLNSNEKIELILTKSPTHNFIVGDIITHDGVNWVKASNTQTNLICGIVTSSLSLNQFKVIFSGYFSGLTGLTANTWYYLGANGTYTTTPVGIRKPLFFALNVNDIIFVNWPIENKYEYSITNTSVVEFTTEFSSYRIIDKDNYLNEVIINFNGTNLNLTIKNLSTLFSETKDTSNKINIYVESNTLKIQNLTGITRNIEIIKV